ncbi:MAG: hypothetical protein BWY47_01529 [Bacteroidetes bacterium ADurb.Bin302]|jgi:hypothetical protein|nr:MAG: hypothetical protein BWY47_01529 [Bacteroidetes bacterium ADurb.Bin302]
MREIEVRKNANNKKWTGSQVKIKNRSDETIAR